MRRITIHDVADEAGVSYQTVSRVMNARPDVSEETRRRVLEVIERLGYQPSAAARSLRGRSNCLGVVAGSLEYFGPSHTLTGIEQQASELGYSLFLKLVPKPEEIDVEKILDDFLAHQVEGVIWSVPEISNNLQWLEHNGHQLEMPLIFISARPRPEISVVNTDNAFGGRLATEHLLAQGYRKIGLITGPETWYDARQREAGWREALLSQGQAAEPRQVVQGDWSTAGGERAFEQLLEQFPEMDSVFASNDQMALGVLQVIYRKRMRVPRDLGLVGFDDIPESAFFLPPLTTIHQDLFDLGGFAVQSLCRLVEARQQKKIVPPETILVKPALVVRKSSVAESSVAERSVAE